MMRCLLQIRHILFLLVYLNIIVFLPASEDLQSPAQQYKVLWVVDGDTIRIDTQGFVRYIGIDTPEVRRRVNDRWQYQPQPFAEEAKKYHMGLVKGKWVRLEFDVTKRDKYGRLLAYVFVDDLMVNVEMVRAGYARLLTIPPNVKYVDELRAALEEARREKRGMWQ